MRREEVLAADAGFSFWRAPKAPTVRLLCTESAATPFTRGPPVAPTPVPQPEAPPPSRAMILSATFRPRMQGDPRPALPDHASMLFPPPTRPRFPHRPLATNAASLSSLPMGTPQALDELLRPVVRLRRSTLQVSAPPGQHQLGAADLVALLDLMHAKLCDSVDAVEQPGLRAGEAFGCMLPAVALRAAQIVLDSGAAAPSTICFVALLTRGEEGVTKEGVGMEGVPAAGTSSANMAAAATDAAGQAQRLLLRAIESRSVEGLLQAMPIPSQSHLHLLSQHTCDRLSLAWLAVAATTRWHARSLELCMHICTETGVHPLGACALGVVFAQASCLEHGVMVASVSSNAQAATRSALRVGDIVRGWDSNLRVPLPLAP